MNAYNDVARRYYEPAPKVAPYRDNPLFEAAYGWMRRPWPTRADHERINAELGLKAGKLHPELAAAAQEIEGIIRRLVRDGWLNRQDVEENFLDASLYRPLCTVYEDAEGDSEIRREYADALAAYERARALYRPYALLARINQIFVEKLARIALRDRDAKRAFDVIRTMVDLRNAIWYARGDNLVMAEIVADMDARLDRTRDMIYCHMLDRLFEGKVPEEQRAADIALLEEMAATGHWTDPEGDLARAVEKAEARATESAATVGFV
jgi:hypothetical protein